MDHIHNDSPLGDHPGGHRGVDAAGQQAQRPAAHAHGKAARPLLRVGVDKGLVVPHLHMDGELRVVDVHDQVGKGVVELASHILGQLDRGHGKALVRPLGLHLKGAGGTQLVPQVLLGAGHNGVLVLGAGSGPAQARHAEQPAHGLPGPFKVTAFVLRLDIGGRLAGIHLKRTVFF